MIGGIFSALVSWFLGLVFPRPQQPTVEAQEAAKAATAETELKTVETSDAQVQAASVARDTVSGRFVSPAKLQQFEQNDPNNLDR